MDKEVPLDCVKKIIAEGNLTQSMNLQPKKRPDGFTSERLSKQNKTKIYLFNSKQTFMKAVLL